MGTSHHAPTTAGRTIRRAWFYDFRVRMMALGKARAIRQMTAELALIAPGEAILDVGCGTGDLTMLAKVRTGDGGRVCGIDAAPEMIAVARRKATRKGLAIDYQIGLIENLPFPDDTFDVTLSSLMMHHLPHTLKYRGLVEIARVLKPGGRLLVVDLRHPTTHQEQVALTLLSHGKLRSGVQDLPTLLEAAGFAQVESGPTRFRPLGFARGRVEN